MRKLFLATTIAAIAALAGGAGAAQAAFVNGDTGVPCPTVTVSGDNVSGGCLIEDFDGTWELWSGSQLVTGCQVHFDLRIQATSAAWAVDQSASCYGLPRRACTNAQGQTIPWTLPAGSPRVMNMCIQNASDAHGTPGTWQAVVFNPAWGPNLELTGINQTNTDIFVRYLTATNGGTEWDEVRWQ